ncbi:hypothetical protein B0H13DRAFT_894787 [Mycena leptocephala]|nr:hypothetical protein B0H13DRAFT_894787 [Mycena leptocephala]
MGASRQRAMGKATECLRRVSYRFFYGYVYFLMGSQSPRRRRLRFRGDAVRRGRRRAGRRARDPPRARGRLGIGQVPVTVTVDKITEHLGVMCDLTTRRVEGRLEVCYDSDSEDVHENDDNDARLRNLTVAIDQVVKTPRGDFAAARAVLERILGGGTAVAAAPTATVTSPARPTFSSTKSASSNSWRRSAPIPVPIPLPSATKTPFRNRLRRSTRRAAKPSQQRAPLSSRPSWARTRHCSP